MSTSLIIHAARVSGGYTVNALAAAAGVARDTVGRIEAGLPVTEQSMRRVATALGIPLGHVFGARRAGLTTEQMRDVALWGMYSESGMTQHEIADTMHLPIRVVQKNLTRIMRDRAIGRAGDELPLQTHTAE
jgi:DNA-binding XRE family transcriptional regulator